MTAADEKARIWGADRRVAKATDRIFIVGIVDNLCSVDLLPAGSRCSMSWPAFIC